MNMGAYRTTVCLPGVLARAKEQFDPISHVLPGGYPVSYDYVGPIVHPERDIARVSNLVGGFAYFQPNQVALVGASFGGMLIPFVVSRLAGSVRDRLKIVIVDAPTGLDTIIDPMARWARLATLASLVTRHIDVPVSEDMLPKLDEISDGLDERRIRAIARRNVTGHKLSALIGPTAWMARVGCDGSLAEACKSLRGLDVTYVACIHPGNGVVRQPRAVAWWRQHVPTLRVVRVEATHCGFLQNEPEFVEVFRDVFGT